MIARRASCLAALPVVMAGGAALAVSVPARACPPGVELLVQQTGDWWHHDTCIARRDGTRCLRERDARTWQPSDRLPAAVRRDSQRVPEASPPRVGTPLVFGDLDPRFVQAAIELYVTELAHCHERVHAAHARTASIGDAHGSVRARFLVTPQGKTERVSVTGFDPVAARCIADVIEALELYELDDPEDVEILISIAFVPESRR